MKEKEHAVWDILQKEEYTEEGQSKLEDMYDHIKGIVKAAGNVTVDGNTVPAMEVFLNMWVENESETFLILSNIIHLEK